MTAGATARTVVLVAAWAAAGILALLAGLLIVAPGAASLLIALSTLGPLPHLAALPIAVGAGVVRRWRLLGASLAVLAAAVITVAPQLTARTDVPVAADQAPFVRVLSWNLRRGAAAGAAAAVIRAEQPDVVVLQEVTASAAATLAPALSGYPGRLVRPRENPFGTLIAVRTPLTGSGTVPGVDEGADWVTVGTVIGPVRIVGVHTTNPLNGRSPLWRSQLDAVGRFVRAAGAPTIVAGDFNASWGNEPFRDLLGDQLTDAAAARGQVWAPTWPARRPALRLDHVLTSRGLVAKDVRRGPSGGSDHRSVKATIALLPSP